MLKCLLIAVVCLLYPISVASTESTNFPLKYQITYSAVDLRCLSEVVYHEARDQPAIGQIAVANVVLNRVKAGFGKSICEVTHKRVKNTCSFSWVCQKNHAIAEKDLWEVSIVVAKWVLEHKDQDYSHGSTYFYATSIKAPYWAKTLRREKVIGQHVFYRS